MSKRIFAFVFILITVASLSVNIVAAQDDTLVIWADEQRADIITEIGAAFTAEYDIPVEVTQVDFGQIRDNFVVAAPAGEGPDIIIGVHDWLGQLHADNLLAPIELDEDLAAQFSPTALAAMSIDGVLYGLPYDLENVAFFRNTELVPDAPATWDDVRQISEELETSGASQYGFVYQNGDAFHFFGIQTAFGGYVSGQDENGNYLANDLGVDSPGSIAALQWASDMVTDGIMPLTTGDEAIALFESGDAAMVITGPWFLSRFRDAEVPYAISDIPAGPDGTPGRPFLGVHGFMVNNLSENTELAVAFITDYLATQDVMALIQERGGRPSAFLPVLAEATDPDFAAFAQAGELGLPMPSIPEMGLVWSAWANGISLALSGESPEEAFTAAGDAIRTEIEATPEAEATVAP